MGETVGAFKTAETGSDFLRTISLSKRGSNWKHKTVGNVMADTAYSRRDLFWLNLTVPIY